MRTKGAPLPGAAPALHQRTRRAPSAQHALRRTRPPRISFLRCERRGRTSAAGTGQVPGPSPAMVSLARLRSMCTSLLAATSRLQKQQGSKMEPSGIVQQPAHCMAELSLCIDMASRTTCQDIHQDRDTCSQSRLMQNSSSGLHTTKGACGVS